MFTESFVLASFLIVFLLQVFFFVFAAAFKTDKLTDLSYGLTFIIVALYALSQSIVPYAWILSFMIIFWGLRLSTYLFIRILHMKTDKRFDGIREHIGKFASFWLFQAITIFVVLLPLAGVVEAKSGPLPTVCLLGLLIWLAGLLIEAIADAQKYSFKKKNPHTWINTGLFRYARYPNYFGEMLVWTGVFIFASPFLGGLYWLAVLSPLTIIGILCFASGIPLLEKQHEARYGKDKAYQAYKKNTRLLVPLPKRPSKK